MVQKKAEEAAVAGTNALCSQTHSHKVNNTWKKEKRLDTTVSNITAKTVYVI
jgi:hypothetical protein